MNNYSVPQMIPSGSRATWSNPKGRSADNLGIDDERVICRNSFCAHFCRQAGAKANAVQRTGENLHTTCYNIRMRRHDFTPRPAQLKWLLDSDPAIRWQVMRDLTG